MAISKVTHHAFFILGIMGIFWGNLYLWQPAINDDRDSGFVVNKLYFEVGAVIVSISTILMIISVT